MVPRRGLTALVLTSLLAGCAAAPPPAPSPAAAPAAAPPSRDFALRAEPHLANMHALTAGGENAEAYWSWAGDALTMQARAPGQACDRIYRLPVTADNRAGGAPIPVSDGKGATTCSFFLPGDKQIIFASTEGGGAACPPRPDHSQGYVWALYPDYDIYRANLDGSGAHRLTTAPGYDAEGTVCPRDGSIVFTSVRDGDIDLYRMEADGSHVRRLTHDVGYDGGAVFNADCSRIVWRASRPKPGKELDDYKRLLAQNLVRPTKLEIYVADADGHDPVQVTYLDAASFGPAFIPSPGGAPPTPTGAPERVIFASNYGDPRGREFDLWAIDVAGTRLERITAAPGFDGFPLVSPDGRRLALASNRATPPGQHDTNVFVADWRPEPIAPARELAADRVLADVSYLADPAREGRGVGTAGLEAAGAYIEARFKSLGLKPAGVDGSYRQPFPLRTGISVEPATTVRLGGVPLPRESFQPAGFSATGNAVGPLVFAGFGLHEPETGTDDYAGVDVKGKIVVVRRFAPDHPSLATPARKRAAGDVRQKAWLAREHGAKALLVVDLPVRPADAPADWKPGDESPLPAPRVGGPGDAGIPVLFVKRAALAPIVERLQRKQRVLAVVDVALGYTTSSAFNVVARLPGTAATPADGAVVIGAHYDHLGLGGRHSLAPDSHLPHLGADDNASGTAALLEVARELVGGPPPAHDVVFAAFSGEEEGVLGSTQLVRTPPPGLDIKALRAMLNMDMVGRLRDNRVTILGAASAEEWPALLGPACSEARIDCDPSLGSGFGPSDQTPFYAAGVPIAHFFTGTHADYHKPSDSADRINAAGAAQIAVAVASLGRVLAGRTTPLTFKQMAAPPPEGDARSFNAALGTIPDYGGPPGGAKGVLLAGVRPGAPAERGGLRRGDILIRLGLHEIGSVEDLMYALNASKPGETVTAVVLRDGHEVKLQVTFEEGRH